MTATVPPEVMASLDDYARTLLRTGHAGDLENARNKHLAALVAAIEKARSGRLRKFLDDLEEPTPEMVEAGRKAMQQSDPKMVSHARVMWVWMDMIKIARCAALFDPPGGQNA